MKKKVTTNSHIFLHSSIKAGLRLQYNLSFDLGLLILNTALSQTSALSPEGVFACMWNNSISIFCNKCRTGMQSVPQKALKGHLGEQAARQVAPEGSKHCLRANPHKYPNKRWHPGQTYTQSLGYGGFCSTQRVCYERGLWIQAICVLMPRAEDEKQFVTWLRASNGSLKLNNVGGSRT